MDLTLRTDSSVFDSLGIEIHPIERTATFKHPEIILSDYLEINEMDVDGMWEVSVSIDHKPILDIANLRVLTLTRMKI